MEYPDIFNSNKLPDGINKKKLIADLLCAWANCMSGIKPPDSFSNIMAQASTLLGSSATPDNLMKLADEIMADK
jgi:hypothetical protein